MFFKRLGIDEKKQRNKIFVDENFIKEIWLIIITGGSFIFHFKTNRKSFEVFSQECLVASYSFMDSYYNNYKKTVEEINKLSVEARKEHLREHYNAFYMDDELSNFFCNFIRKRTELLNHNFTKKIFGKDTDLLDSVYYVKK